MSVETAAVVRRTAFRRTKQQFETHTSSSAYCARQVPCCKRRAQLPTAQAAQLADAPRGQPLCPRPELNVLSTWAAARTRGGPACGVGTPLQNLVAMAEPLLTAHFALPQPERAPRSSGTPSASPKALPARARPEPGACPTPWIAAGAPPGSPGSASARPSPRLGRNGAATRACALARATAACRLNQQHLLRVRPRLRERGGGCRLASPKRGWNSARPRGLKAGRHRFCAKRGGGAGPQLGRFGLGRGGGGRRRGWQIAAAACCDSRWRRAAGRARGSAVSSFPRGGGAPPFRGAGARRRAGRRRGPDLRMRQPLALRPRASPARSAPAACARAPHCARPKTQTLDRCRAAPRVPRASPPVFL